MHVQYDYSQLVGTHARNSAGYISQKVNTLKYIRARLAEANGVLDNVTVFALLWLTFADVCAYADIIWRTPDLVLAGTSSRYTESILTGEISTVRSNLPVEATQEHSAGRTFSANIGSVRKCHISCLLG